MDKFIGKTLNDRYILTEIVGVGGMAVVYKAFDRVVNRVVAVKILKEEFMSDAQFRRRFTNESKAITMLSQNNIVDVYDVCLDGDMMYIVMEYLDGITLKEYIDKVKVLDWKEAAFYIKQILKAMSHAHERGIVHRDLKPHNIMLFRDGTIKVTDFGIAKLSKFDTQTITDKAIGSVHYISPEQASGDRTDEKTDIYSVGVMFYEMITGTLPFLADSPVSVALMQVQAQPELPRDINPDIPVGVEEITIKAMMKDPSMRYSSALQMFNDILEVEKDESVSFGYLDVDDSADLDEQHVEDDSPTRFVDISDAAEQETEIIDDEQTEEYETSKFKDVWLPIICGVGTAVVTMLIVVLSILFFPEIKTFFNKTNNVVEMVVVEDYVGEDYDTISKENATGLKFEKVNVLSNEKTGQILSQDPAAGTEVEKGSIITFKVSTGVETVQIPDLAEKHYQVALDELFDLGIKYKTKYESSDTIKENYVIKTDPKAYEEIKSDSTITIYISSGPEIVMVEVPDLINLDEDDAVEELQNRNLIPRTKREYNDSVPKGCVFKQSVEAKTKVEERTSVDIYISEGPEPKEEEPKEENNNETNPPVDENPVDKPVVDDNNTEDTKDPSSGNENGGNGETNDVPVVNPDDTDDTDNNDNNNQVENNTPPNTETSDKTNDDKTNEGSN